MTDEIYSDEKGYVSPVKIFKMLLCLKYFDQMAINFSTGGLNPFSIDLFSKHICP